MSETKDIYKALYEDNPCMQLTVDVDGTIKTINKLGAEQLGYKPEELVGKSLDCVCHSEDNETAHENIKKCLKNPGKPFDWELRKVRKDDSVLWVKETARSVNGVEGEQNVIIVSNDITESKKLNDELNNAQLELENLLEERTGELETINEALYEEISERKKTELELTARTHQHALLVELGQLALSETDLLKLFNEAVRITAKTLKLKYCKVLELLPDGKELLLKSGVGWKKGYVGKATVGTEKSSQAGYTLFLDEPVVVENLNEETRFSPSELLTEHGVASGISVVIQGRNQPWGVLGVHSKRVRNFSRDDVNFLQAVSNTLSEAIERKEVEEALKENLSELEKKNRYEKIISTVTRSVHQSINLDDVLENAAGAMSGNIENAEHVAIYLVEGTDAVMRAFRGHPDWFVKLVSRIPHPRGFTWEVINNGKPRYCPDADKDEVIGVAGKKVGTKSYLGMPIFSDGEAVGCICINSFIKHAFDKDDLKQLEIVAGQIQVAINNARQAKALRENLSELEKKNRYEKIISTITRSVHQSINLDDVLENAVDALSKNMDGVDNVVIYFKEGKEAVMMAYRGFSVDIMERLDIIPYPKGLTWKTLIEGKPIYCPDTEKDPHIGPVGREMGTKSYIAIPLKHEGETMGCIDINSLEVDAFDENDLNVIKIVASQIEVAINNARQTEAIRLFDERLKTIFRESLDVIMVVDAETEEIITVNRATERILGYKEEDLKGKNFQSLLSPNSHLSRDELLDNLSVQGRVFESQEFVRRDGTECPIDITATMVPWNEGKAILLTLRDITERRRAEEQIREQAALLDKAQDAIIVRDMENKIIYWNKSAERLYGWAEEQTLGKRADELLNPKDLSKLVEAESAVILKGEWAGELTQVTNTGEEKVVESRWTLVKDAHGRNKSVLVINTDITEKKALEAQFLHAQRMESLGTLAGGIAHDLNNVLAPILMSVQILKSKATDERSEKMINILESNTLRGADIVRQVLTFARGVEGKRVPVNPKYLITEISNITTGTFPKSIKIETKVSSEFWNLVGDVTQLLQVLLNLSLNARDAMPGGGLLKISSGYSYIDKNYASMNTQATPGNYVVLTVEDSGKGIRAELLDKIFEPFFTTKEVGEGTGLGLSTVSGIVKSHNGFIEVESVTDKGTKFSVYIPASKTKDSAEDSSLDLSIPRGNGELVMIVDDEPSFREITKETLLFNGYNVLTANDGTEAVALAAENKEEIQAVITDMMMPVMDGAATIKALRKIKPELKIIGTSGLNAEDKYLQSSTTGVQAFLSKPYTAAMMLQCLAEILDKSTSAD
ncbi:MAG: PAS domain S-box protein [Candidatus Dadabacteria bacterium]|nr:PAS domain S-box protein [Candidatus Dadabacteria bacterium]